LGGELELCMGVDHYRFLEETRKALTFLGCVLIKWTEF